MGGDVFIILDKNSYFLFKVVEIDDVEKNSLGKKINKLKNDYYLYVLILIYVCICIYIYCLIILCIDIIVKMCCKSFDLYEYCDKWLFWVIDMVGVICILLLNNLLFGENYLVGLLCLVL